MVVVSTRRQRRAENRRKHRELRRRKVTTYDDLVAERDRNPVVHFRARGRTVRFTAKPKRRGKVPKQLRPYLFKRRR